MIEIKKAKPTSPGRRHVVSVKNTELHTGKPFKGLVEVKKARLVEIILVELQFVIKVVGINSITV